MSDDNIPHRRQQRRSMNPVMGSEDAPNTAAGGWVPHPQQNQKQHSHDSRQNQPNQKFHQTPSHHPAAGTIYPVPQTSLSEGAVFSYAGRPLSSLTNLSSLVDLTTTLPLQPLYDHDRDGIPQTAPVGPTRWQASGEPQPILARLSTGLVRGILLPGATYLWQTNYAAPQRRYMTLLDQPITDADYGGDILDPDTGHIVGHIAHASQYSRVQMVYIMSSADLLAGLNSRFQDEARGATTRPGGDKMEMAVYPLDYTGMENSRKADPAMAQPASSPFLSVETRPECIADSVADSMSGSIAGSFADGISCGVLNSISDNVSENTAENTAIIATINADASTSHSMAGDTAEVALPQGLTFQEYDEQRHDFSAPIPGVPPVMLSRGSPSCLSTSSAGHGHGHRHQHRYGHDDNQHRPLPMQFIHYKGTNNMAERGGSSRSSGSGAEGEGGLRLQGPEGGSEGTDTGGGRGGGETDNEMSVDALLPDKKCPFRTCEYHVKGFVRKHDLVRHIITHYDGRLYCGFCPDGLAKSFGRPFLRVEPLKRHLAAVHGASKVRRMQTTTETYLKDRIKEYGWVSVGQCSICARAFSTAPELYNHIEGCVLQQLLKRAKELDHQPAQEEVHPRHSRAVNDLNLDSRQ